MGWVEEEGGVKSAEEARGSLRPPPHFSFFSVGAFFCFAHPYDRPPPNLWWGRTGGLWSEVGNIFLCI